MPEFTRGDVYTFFESFVDSLSFVLSAFLNLIDNLKSIPFVYIFFCLLSFLLIVYACGWLILEVSQYAGGSSFGNPYKQIYANKLGGVTDFYSIGLKVKRNREKQENENKRVKESLIREQENSARAQLFFENNPHSYRISIDGKTYWREGWEQKRWDGTDEMREVVHYEVDKNSGKLKEKYHTYSKKTEFNGSISDNQPSFDIQKAMSRKNLDFGNMKNRRKKSNVDIEVNNENS